MHHYEERPSVCSIFMESDTWDKVAIPSTSQTCRDSYRNENEHHESPVLFHSDLPGSVSDFFDELQAHPSCIIKSIAIDNDSIQSPDKEGESWLNKIGLYTRKLTFLNCWKSRKEDTAELERGVHKLQDTFLGQSCGPGDMTGDMPGCGENDGLPYVPYELAKMYIVKVVKDMQTMKLKHRQTIKETEENAMKKQEQEINLLKNTYRNKMKILKTRLESYQDIMEQKTAHLQDKIKGLEEEQELWQQERASLLFEIQVLKERLGQEKVHGCNENL